MFKQCINYLKSLPLREGDRILCALSGGGDSVGLALMLGLLSHSPTRYGLPPFSLAMAHYNHNLRGEQSNQDQDFVTHFVTELLPSVLSRHCVIKPRNIPLCIESGMVADYGGNLEATARELRYDFFERTATNLHATYIATAHTAEDNAETLLLHLARGCGTRGLCGIPPRRGNIIRPLLQVSKQEILSLLHEYDVPYREDLSNFDTTYRRNFIRHEITPKLLELNPHFHSHCSNTMSILSEENNYLDFLVEKKLPYRVSPFGVEVACADLLNLPSALLPRGVARLGREVGVVTSYQHILDVLALVRDPSPSKSIDLPCGVVVSRQYQALLFSKVSPPKPLETLSLNVGSVMVLGYEITLAPSAVGVTLPLWVRQRGKGDHFTPLKRPRKSLKKWLIDAKIPKAQRDTLPIVTNAQNQVVFVPSLGVGEGFMTTPQTGQKVYTLNIQKIGE